MYTAYIELPQITRPSPSLLIFGAENRQTGYSYVKKVHVDFGFTTPFRVRVRSLKATNGQTDRRTGKTRSAAY